MILPIIQAFQRFRDAVDAVDVERKRVLDISRWLGDPGFAIKVELEAYAYEAIRRLFRHRFISAFQIPNGEYREIPHFDWESDVNAFLVLADGYYLHRDPFAEETDAEKFEIYFDTRTIESGEIDRMLNVMLAYSRPLGDRSSIYSNLGDKVAGEFKPTDPGVPRSGIRLCDAFGEYLSRRFGPQPNKEDFVAEYLQFAEEAPNREVFLECVYGAESLRRGALAEQEFRHSLAKDEISVWVRSQLSTDPIAIPSAIWWVSNEFDDPFAHQIIHAEATDPLSLYNGAAPFLDKQDFERWLGIEWPVSTASISPAKRGRKPGGRFYSNDEAAIEKIKAALANGSASTVAAAVRLFEHEIDGASLEAKIKRMRRRLRCGRDI